MGGAISKQAAKVAVEALKEAGVNFVAVLPDFQHTELQELVQADKSFMYHHVSEEGIGYATCAGAWYGGKRPAIIVTTAGLHNMCWAVSAFRNYHAPVLMLIPHRGVAGDTIWFMRKYIHKIEQYLQLFEIPYQVVNKIDEIKPTIIRAEKTINHLLIPFVILFSGDTIW